VKGRSLSTSRSAEDAAGRAVMASCDEWTGSRYCGALALHLDEVDDRRYCLEHAGPLAWSARDVNLYSLALFVAGKANVNYLMPAELRDRLYPTVSGERAA
jgi:hypothetical protein